MTGRVLFALVWVIIAAGVALPLYPRDIPESVAVAAADPVQLVAGTDTFGCEDCVVPDSGRARCKSDCPCGEAVPAMFVPLKHQVRLTIGVILPIVPSSSPNAPHLLPAI